MNSKNYNTFRLFILATLCALSIAACSKNSLSDRDVKKEQIKNSADTKRKELQQVAGFYKGKFTQGNGLENYVTLVIEIKDIPTTIEGQVDPILIPTLTGYLKLFLGDDDSPTEYDLYSIQKADYDPSRKKVNLVVEDSNKQQIILLLAKGERLTGDWTSPAVGASGKADLSIKKDTP